MCICSHRNFAESVAAALAPSFADATSSMYNNITDYVLGPMHGQPYPITSQRPLPKHATDVQLGCRSDDSDYADDDPASSQALPVTEADSCSMDSADNSSPFILSTVESDSATTPTSALAVSFCPPESQQSMASASSQFTLDDHVHPPSHQAEPMTCSELKDRPSVLKGGTSPQTNQLSDSADADDNDDDDDDDVDVPVLKRRLLSTARGHVNSPSQDTDGKRRQIGDLRPSFGFSLPRSWKKGKRSRSDDGSQESHDKGPGSGGPAVNSPEAEGKTEDLVKPFAAVNYKQHKLTLNFVDGRVERRYCAWQAQQRTKVHFSVMMACLCHVPSVLQLAFHRRCI